MVTVGNMYYLVGILEQPLGIDTLALVKVQIALEPFRAVAENISARLLGAAEDLSEDGTCPIFSFLAHRRRSQENRKTWLRRIFPRGQNGCETA